jgi:O-antigen ligase
VFVLPQIAKQSSRVVLFALLTLVAVFCVFATVYEAYYLLLLPIVVGLLLLAFFYTEKSLLFFGSLVPLSINFDDVGGGLGLTLPTEPLFIVLFLLIVFRWLLKPEIDLQMLAHPISVSILCYLIWLWTATIFSSMPMVSFKFVMARTWYIVLFYFTVLSLFREFKNIHWFFKAFTVTTLALVIFTLSKHAADGFIRSSSYGISWPFFPDHGMYAAAIAFAVFILVIYGLAGRHFGISLPFAPAILLLLAILIFGIVVSYTRATWLSLVAALAVYVILKMRIKFGWVLLALAGVLTYGIAQQDQIMYNLEANKQGSSDDIEGHVKSVSNVTTDPSNLERINRWKCASRMVAERPWFGFGPGTYVFQYSPFQKSDELTLISTFSGDLGDAHSEYFSAMSEAGYIGLLSWLGVVLTTLGVSFRVFYREEPGKVRYTLLMALLGLITYYVHAFLNNYSQYDKIAVPLWTFTAVITALDLYHRGQLKSTPTHVEETQTK